MRADEEVAEEESTFGSRYVPAGYATWSTTIMRAATSTPPPPPPPPRGNFLPERELAKIPGHTGSRYIRDTQRLTKHSIME
eukprot:865152-Prymnesium_polylepis.2